MNKKNNRKGFTTVELVIVIAVIAILATVLIPTFSGLVGDANKTAALQDANSILKTWMANPENAKDFTDETELYIVSGDYVFHFDNNVLDKTPVPASALPCGATRIGDATLPDGYTQADSHGTKKDGKCPTCGVDLP